MPLAVETIDTATVPVLDGRCVLIADDDNVCRALVLNALAAAGATVVEAEDGRQAVMRAVSSVPDLLITDLDMPELDGLAATGILRWDFGLVNLPIIAMSAVPPLAADLLASGVNAFLPKPVDPDHLVAAVAACLNDDGDPTHSVGADAPSPAIFDLTGALTRMGGKSGLLSRLVAVFLENHRGAGREVAKALEAGDTNCAHRICHALVGTGASVGAVRLQGLAGILEQKLRGGDFPNPMEVEELVATMAVTAEAMSTWLAASDAPRSLP